MKKNKQKIKVPEMRSAHFEIVGFRSSKNEKVMTMGLVSNRKDSYNTIIPPEGCTTPIEGVMVDYNHNFISTGSYMEDKGIQKRTVPTGEGKNPYEEIDMRVVDVHVPKTARMLKKNPDQTQPAIDEGSLYDAVESGRVRWGSVYFQPDENNIEVVSNSDGKVLRTVYKKWSLLSFSLLDVPPGQDTSYTFNVRSLNFKKRNMNLDEIKQQLTELLKSQNVEVESISNVKLELESDEEGVITFTLNNDEVKQVDYSMDNNGELTLATNVVDVDDENEKEEDEPEENESDEDKKPIQEPGSENKTDEEEKEGDDTKENDNEKENEDNSSEDEEGDVDESKKGKGRKGMPGMKKGAHNLKKHLGAAHEGKQNKGGPKPKSSKHVHKAAKLKLKRRTIEELEILKKEKANKKEGEKRWSQVGSLVKNEEGDVAKVVECATVEDEKGDIVSTITLEMIPEGTTLTISAEEVGYYSEGDDAPEWTNLTDADMLTLFLQLDEEEDGEEDGEEEENEDVEKGDDEEPEEKDAEEDNKEDEEKLKLRQAQEEKQKLEKELEEKNKLLDTANKNYDKLRSSPVEGIPAKVDSATDEIESGSEGQKEGDSDIEIAKKVSRSRFGLSF